MTGGEGMAQNAEQFTAKAKEVVALKIRLFDDAGNMLLTAAYHLEVGDEKFDGTASDGWVKQKLKATAVPDSCWLEWQKDQSGNFMYSLDLNLKFEGSREESLISHLKNIGYIPDPELTRDCSQTPEEAAASFFDVLDDFKNRFYLRGNVKSDQILKLCEKGVEGLNSGDKLLASLQ